MSNQNGQVFDFFDHETKIDKIVKKNFVASYMSNIKWRKCFELLNHIQPDLQVVWKFVDKDDGVTYTLPANESLKEKYIDSRFWFGPVYYKEIEWLEFLYIGKPYGKENIPSVFFEQDIEGVLEALNKIGQWQVIKTDLGFRLYGYK